MRFRILILLPLFLLQETYAFHSADTLRLTKEEYAEKVKAMWLGQIVAVQMGLQFEHKPAAVKEIRDYPESKTEELIRNGGSTVDDDWYYEMCALSGFEEYGSDMTVEELGDVWLKFNMGTFGSAYYTRKALLMGMRGAVIQSTFAHAN